jgi:tRNA (guanine37-N1)-methyltransferase
MRIDIMTLFPAMCEAVLSESIVGRARKSGFIEIYCHDIRSYSTDKHRHVDDYTYGGGMGMVMQPEPIYNCFKAVCEAAGTRPRCVYMSPQGRVFDQKSAVRFSALSNIAILCGHYEGVDQRIIDEIVDEEISIGDFVLTGGELPALMFADAVARLLPGVLSGEECYQDESHFSGLLEYPQYTRPPEFMGRTVPEVLLSGHAANIAKWRRTKAIERTFQRRPDMLERAELSAADLRILDGLRRETGIKFEEQAE